MTIYAAAGSTAIIAARGLVGEEPGGFSAEPRFADGDDLPVFVGDELSPLMAV